ncbi:MAG: tol-pal system protein YbgF [Gammaproteobacteria bacterium]|nr:tol-pal system protein YbgF [Gammaproteobacteria bacterium]
MQVVFKSSLLLSSLLVISQAIASPPRTAPEPLQQYGAAPALDGESEQRLNLLEKKLDNNVIYDLLDQITQLKREVSELREFTEQQGHQMGLLTKRQRSLYQDIDRRMLELEAGSSSRRGMPASKRITTGPSSSGLTVTSGGQTSAPASGIKPVSIADVANEQAAYTKAFNLLKEGNYNQSITAFRAFLSAHGKGKYADNAQYWLGEASYVSRDYKRALSEFQQLISQYPESSKNPGARLKIGYVYFELKNWSAASEALQQVISLYRETTVAKKANERLQRMKREGH